MLVFAAFGSAGLHWLALLGLLSLRAENQATPGVPQLSAIEFIELDSEPDQPRPPPRRAPLALEPRVDSSAEPSTVTPPRRRVPRAPRATPSGPAAAPALRPTPGPLALDLGRARTQRHQGLESKRGAGLITSDPRALAQIDPEPRPAGPAPPTYQPPQDRLVPMAGGKLGYEDPSGLFTAYIQPDGSVRFVDAKNVQGAVCVALVCLGRGQPPSVKRGGDEVHHTMRVSFAPVLAGAGGVFGRQLAVPRAQTEFLQRTFEMRMRMTMRWQRKQIARQLQALESQLEDVWKDARYTTPQARKRVFRELWEECDADAEVLPAYADDLPRELRELRTLAARRARKLIEGFYRERTGESLW